MVPNRLANLQQKRKGWKKSRCCNGPKFIPEISLNDVAALKVRKRVPSNLKLNRQVSSWRDWWCNTDDVCFKLLLLKAKCSKLPLHFGVASCYVHSNFIHSLLEFSKQKMFVFIYKSEGFKEGILCFSNDFISCMWQSKWDRIHCISSIKGVQPNEKDLDMYQTFCQCHVPSFYTCIIHDYWSP